MWFAQKDGSRAVQTLHLFASWGQRSVLYREAGEEAGGKRASRSLGYSGWSDPTEIFKMEQFLDKAQVSTLRVLSLIDEAFGLAHKFSTLVVQCLRLALDIIRFEVKIFIFVVWTFIRRHNLQLQAIYPFLKKVSKVDDIKKCLTILIWTSLQFGNILGCFRDLREFCFRIWDFL